MDVKNMSAEFLAKAKACTSKEEFMKIASEEGIELSDDELEGLAGGTIWTLLDDDEDWGDTRDGMDPSAAPISYRLGQVGYADLDW